MYTTETLVKMMRDGLLEIGYREDLLQNNYGFTDMFSEDQPLRSVELGVFAQDPPSYRNACFGVVVPPYDGSEVIANYRALGAPQIFALHPEREQVICWKMLADRSPIFLEKIEAPHLRNAIQSRRDEWNPQSILRAKSIRFTNQPIQLDFFDIGLLPALESVVYPKLNRLLNDVIASCEAVYKEHRKEELDYEALFRLIFRLIAAKLLGDRQYPGRWLSTNAQEVIKLVEDFYFQHTSPEAVLDDMLVQDTAWRQIRKAFSFCNLSVEALAYVYENTLITPQARQELGTHATPPEIAEYIVQNIPLEELDEEDRRIFEPFCGHAPFLTAALARLRALLPLDMSAEQRHDYLIRMLSGMEVDSFACEIARNSLILADYPNPNGWAITKTDFFASDETDKYLTQAQVILCNPPYEDFSLKDRQSNCSIHSANKAVEAFHRILQHPPKMLGIVLPRVFINGQSYRQIKKQINSLYDDITLVELPRIFNFSDAESVLLIAHGSRTAKSVWHSVLVEKKDYQQFVSTGRPTLRIERSASIQSEGSTAFGYGRLHRIWNELATLPRLGDIAEIHRGMEYNISLKDNEDKLFSEVPREGFVKGLRRVTGDFEPYIARSSTYLNMDLELQRREAYKLPWDRPKVIANAAHKGTGDRWLIAAAIDEQGLVCTQRFHGIWPTGSLPIEVIAALLNGPIANAFLSINRTSRDNQIRVLRQIPIPHFTKSQIHLIVSLVREYIATREQWLSQPKYAQYLGDSCEGILGRIQEEILGFYNLSMETERELITYFEGYKGLGPIPLTQIEPSPQNRLYTSLIRVEDVKGEGDDKIVDVEIFAYHYDQIIHLPVALFPQELREKISQDVWLWAGINIEAREEKDLIFENIELAPEPRQELRDKFA